MRQVASAGPAFYPELEGKLAFVTGGASGIGAEIVWALSRQKAKVAFIDIDESACSRLSVLVERAGFPLPWWRRVDVRDVAQLQQAIHSAASELGDFDILVNNVASDDRHEIGDVTADLYDDRIAINQRPAFFAVQAVIDGMKRLGGGSIVNLGSTGWQNKASGYACYAIAKSSINGLTRGLARDLGKERIRINTVTPGWVMTQRQLEKWVDEDGERLMDQSQCLPGRVRPSDVAAMVVFLASDQSRMCTAQEYVVDAGWL